MNSRKGGPGYSVENPIDDVFEAGNTGKGTGVLPIAESIDISKRVASHQLHAAKDANVDSTYPPTIVMNVYMVKPRIKKTLVILIQNSASPNHRTDQRFRAPRMTIPAEMAMAGERVRVQ